MGVYFTDLSYDGALTDSGLDRCNRSSFPGVKVLLSWNYSGDCFETVGCQDKNLLDISKDFDEEDLILYLQSQSTN